jgi:hypothetical protein
MRKVVALTALILGIAALNLGDIGTKTAQAGDPVTQKALRGLSTRIAKAEVKLWRCQDQLQQPRTPYSVSPGALPQSKPYRQWTLKLWEKRSKACLDTLHQQAKRWRHLENGIAHYYRTQGRNSGPLSGQGALVERVGKKYGLSPFFLIATSVTESSMGLAACRNNSFNIWGLSSCGSGWYVPPFRSWEEAFDFYARFLIGKTSVTSGWPNARTPYDYVGYAACSECWGRKTAEHMSSIFGVSSSTRYG